MRLARPRDYWDAASGDYRKAGLVKRKAKRYTGMIGPTCIRKEEARRSLRGRLGCSDLPACKCRQEEEEKRKV